VTDHARGISPAFLNATVSLHDDRPLLAPMPSSTWRAAEPDADSRRGERLLTLGADRRLRPVHQRVFLLPLNFLLPLPTLRAEHLAGSAAVGSSAA